MEKLNKNLGFVEIVMLIVGIITILLQIFPPKNQQQQTLSLALFLAILFYIALLFVFDWLARKVKFYIDQIDSNILKDTNN